MSATTRLPRKQCTATALLTRLRRCPRSLSHGCVWKRHTATPSTSREFGSLPLFAAWRPQLGSLSASAHAAASAEANTAALMLASSEPMLPTDAVDHFSYGANTASSTLAKRGVEVLASRPAMLVDPGMAISFRHRGGFATLIREPPRDGTDPRLQRGNVHGVLYTLSKPDLAALQRAETGYTLEAVRVCTYPPAAAPACTAAALGSMGSSEESRSAAGSLAIAISRSEATSQDRAVLATAFVSRPMLRLRHPVPPTEQYLKLLKAGAREHGLDSAYVAWLASVPSVDRPGLPPAYFDTESNTVAQGFLVLVALATVCIYWPHKEHTQPFVADTNIPVVASDSM